jgi:hypothetical protein
LSPAASVTIAFFQSGSRVRRSPYLFTLPRIVTVLTPVTVTLNAAGTMSRRVVEVRLSPFVKGKLFQVQLAGTGQARVYACKVLVKDLGTPTPTGWRWTVLPIPETPDNYPSTRALAIPGTPETYNNVRPLPIPETPNDYPNRIPFPIRETPLEPSWVTLPMDAIE